MTLQDKICIRFAVVSSVLTMAYLLALRLKGMTTADAHHWYIVFVMPVPGGYVGERRCTGCGLVERIDDPRRTLQDFLS